MASVRTRPLLIAVVAILAIALAAATLNTAVDPGGSVASAGDGPFVGDADRSTGDDRDANRLGFLGFGGAFPVIPLPCYPILNELWFLAAVAFGAGTVLYGLYRWKGPLVPYAIVAGLAPPGLLVHALLTACREAETVRLSLPLAARVANSTGAFSLAGGAGSGGTPVVPLALVGVLALALVVSVALLVVTSGDHDAEPTTEPVAPDAEPLGAIGRAAGRAADRIEDDADPDNAVFRAWKEMTDRLDVRNPAASTPAEFATAAVAAGMEPADVDELTSLFEAVRYGTAVPTEARESRAVAALRRIESTYAGDGP